MVDPKWATEPRDLSTPENEARSVPIPAAPTIVIADPKCAYEPRSQANIPAIQETEIEIRDVPVAAIVFAAPKIALEPREEGIEARTVASSPAAPTIVVAAGKYVYEPRDVPVLPAPSIVVADPEFASEDGLEE